jgi:hypothetical protein
LNVSLNIDEKLSDTNKEPITPEGALASFFHSALGFSPTLTITGNELILQIYEDVYVG